MRLKQNSLLEPLEIQNAKTSSTSLKRDEYIEKEKLLLNLSGIEVFFRTERILSEIIIKKIISIFIIQLHYLGDTLDK